MCFEGIFRIPPLYLLVRVGRRQRRRGIDNAVIPPHVADSRTGSHRTKAVACLGFLLHAQMISYNGSMSANRKEMFNTPIKINNPSFQEKKRKKNVHKNYTT